MGCGNCYVPGTPLLEVYSVTIRKTDNNETGSEVYGTVCVTDELGTKVNLYQRDHHNSESISPNGTLTLRSPPICTSAGTGFTIDVDLNDKDQDFEIKQKIFWGVKDTCYYDKRLSIIVPGENGVATVNCAVFSVATSVSVEIMLSKRDGSDGDSDILSNIGIYGTIVAYYGSMFDYTGSDQSRYFQTVLFNHSAGNCPEIKLDEPVPLLRSIVVVPSYSSLVIEADLYRCDSEEPVLKGKTLEMRHPLMYKESEIVGGSLIAKVRC